MKAKKEIAEIEQMRENRKHYNKSMRAQLDEVKQSIKTVKNERDLLENELELMKRERDKWRTKHNLLFEYLYIGK